MVAKQFLGNIKGPKGDTGSFGSVTADADNTNLEQPVVTVDTSGPDYEKNFDFHFKGLKGRKGGYYKPAVDEEGIITFTYESDGDATEEPPIIKSTSVRGPTGLPGGFGEITAQITGEVGTPEVSVNATGPNDAKNLEFLFKNLKGIQGEQGFKGDKGDRGGLTYKPLSEARFKKLMEAGTQIEDFDYIYYLDPAFIPDSEDQSLFKDVHNAVLILFAMRGLDTHLISVLRLLWIDRATVENGLEDYFDSTALYLNSVPVIKEDPLGYSMERYKGWIRIFPFHTVTTEDIDAMIAGTYHNSYGELAFIESNELAYFIHKLQE